MDGFDSMVISRWVDGRRLKGFLLADPQCGLRRVTLDEVRALGFGIRYENASFSEEYGTLEGAHGVSLTEYPEIDDGWAVTGKSGVVVMYELRGNGGTPVGVVCFNGAGLNYKIEFNTLERLLKTNRAVNFKFALVDGYRTVVHKNNMPFVYAEVSVSRRENNGVCQHDAFSAPMVSPYDIQSLVHSKFNQPCQEKLVLAQITMQAITPYYSTIFQAIPRKPAPIGTIGVTETTMYYDMQFLAGMQDDELVFIFIHEIMHLAMQHSIRGVGRLHDLWNIACDLYINSIICRDFDIRYGGPARNFGTEASPRRIKVPSLGVFMETVNEKVDFATDTPEAIYSRLLKENSSNPGVGSNDFSDSANARMKDVDVTLNGKTLKGKIIDDIMTENSSDSAGKENVEKSRESIQRIATKIKMTEEELGCKLSKQAGLGGSLVERNISFGLSSSVDWRVLLKNLCKDHPRKMFTLSSPNRNYMSSGMTVADRRVVRHTSRLTKIKFAVDVSGSVSGKELDMILGEIGNIYRYFELDGELIYWSTEIGSVGEFSSMRGLLGVAPKSTGGTDVRCVFDYLSGQVRFDGRIERDLVRDIPAVFIITDGRFPRNYEGYARSFGAKTVWMIVGSRGNPIMFDPPFGRVVQVEL